MTKSIMKISPFCDKHFCNKQRQSLFFEAVMHEEVLFGSSFWIGSYSNMRRQFHFWVCMSGFDTTQTTQLDTLHYHVLSHCLLPKPSKAWRIETTGDTAMLLEWSPAPKKVDNRITFFFIFSINSFSDGVHLATKHIWGCRCLSLFLLCSVTHSFN